MTSPTPAPTPSEPRRSLAELTDTELENIIAEQARRVPAVPLTSGSEGSSVDVDALCERIRKSAALARLGSPAYGQMLVYHYTELEALVIALASARAALDAKDAKYCTDTTALRAIIDDQQSALEEAGRRVDAWKELAMHTITCGLCTGGRLCSKADNLHREAIAAARSVVPEQIPLVDKHGDHE